MLRRWMLAAFLLSVLGLPGALASDYVQFSYQAKVRLYGLPVTGEARVKMAIVNASGDRTLWSNDMTSVNGSEPKDSFSVTVESGVLDVMAGDTELGMEPIHGIIFNGREGLKLRVWLKSGLHDFERLKPDRAIPNPRVLRLTEITEPLTLYVNGATGDDENTGLNSKAPKKTIQAAVDVLPKQISNNVTVDIADGTYAEEVSISNYRCDGSYNLTLKGDDSAEDLETNDPLVKLEGGSTMSTGLLVRGSNGVVIRGIQVKNFKNNGVLINLSQCSLDRCKVTDNYYGFFAMDQCRANFTDCVAKSNGSEGFAVWYNSSSGFRNCSALQNGHVGVNIQHSSFGKFDGTGNFSGNEESGVWVYHNSSAWFDTITYKGKMNNNHYYGIRVYWTSNARWYGLNSFSGNGSGKIDVQNGCHAE